MNARLALARAPLLATYALLLAALALTSSLLDLFPFEVAPHPAGLWIWGGLMLALLPALLTAGSPLPVMLALLVPVAVAASYGQSHLDWLRTLKDLDVVDPGAPNALRLALEVGALLAAWAAHALDLSLRMRARMLARGVPADQARLAARATRTRALLAAGAAVAGVAVLAGAATLAYNLQLALGRVTFLMPIVAAALVALAAVLLSTRDRGEAEPDAEQA